MRARNGWRVIGILPEELREREGLAFEDLLPWLREETGRGLSFQACHWFSTYRIQHRCAERFRDRAGRADDALLDSYAAERMPVAHRLLETTDRAFKLIVSKSWLAGLFRTRIMAVLVAQAMKRQRARRLAFMTLSQTGIQYRQSPLSQTIAAAPGAPQAGDRFPWLHLEFSTGGPREDVFQRMDDTRFTLLIVGQPGSRASLGGFGDLVNVHTVPETPANQAALKGLSIEGPAYYLVRPDGYIALAGSHFNEADVRLWFADHHVHAAGAGRRIEERLAC